MEENDIIFQRITERQCQKAASHHRACVFQLPAVRVRRLAQGHLDTLGLVGAGDRTSNLLLNSQPTLPPELCGPQSNWWLFWIPDTVLFARRIVVPTEILLHRDIQWCCHGSDTEADMKRKIAVVKAQLPLFVTVDFPHWQFRNRSGKLNPPSNIMISSSPWTSFKKITINAHSCPLWFVALASTNQNPGGLEPHSSGNFCHN